MNDLPLTGGCNCGAVRFEVTAPLIVAASRRPARRASVSAVTLREHSARRGDFRVIYEILEDERVVLIHRAAHRSHVYRPR